MLFLLFVQFLRPLLYFIAGFIVFQVILWKKLSKKKTAGILQAFDHLMVNEDKLWLTR